MNKRRGRLFYDDSVGRFDIEFEDGSEYGGLHCGEVFEAFYDSEWKYTRIEINGAGKWYFTGLPENVIPEVVKI